MPEPWDYNDPRFYPPETFYCSETAPCGRCRFCRQELADQRADYEIDRRKDEKREVAA